MIISKDKFNTSNIGSVNDINRRDSLTTMSMSRSQVLGSN